MEKLTIIICAYNEEEHIYEAIKDIPHNIEGVKQVQVVVVNDGSQDSTAEVLKRAGVRHIINFEKRRGLGSAFRAGIAYALGIESDIIVNMDADCQYRGAEIRKIIAPILEGRARVVIGDRQLIKVPRYPLYKLISQHAANILISILFKMHVRDATSGFRAFSREVSCMLKEDLKNDYTYTIESIGILARRNIDIFFMPVNIRYPTRASRLISNKPYYVINLLKTILQCRLKKY